MRPPFWIVNSALLFLFMLALGFVFFSRPRPPARESLAVSEYIKPIRTDISQIPVEKIYQEDLFGTYVKEITRPAEETLVPPMPPTPEPQRPIIHEEPTPQFLDPLGVTLKGIIVVVTDDTQNRAIIMDNQTNKEARYKVGDKIEDAQLIRIFSNKIVFIRSNGQQEILYLRERDAQLDPSYAIISGWDEVIRKIDDNDYGVDVDTFAERVPNLAQFIDMLDLTTVYKQGSSIGCRVGVLLENSLGIALGLRTGDIILTVNSIPAAGTSDRFKIYKNITALKTGDTVELVVQRNGREITIIYHLEEIKKGITGQPQAVAQKAREEMMQEQQKILQEKYKFAPTVRDIRQREKNIMREKGQFSRKFLSNDTE